MNVLLVGSGGREDALAWALARSPRIGSLRCAPGNAGTARRASNLNIADTDVDALARHARTERYDLVVVGPEAPLVLGLADRLADEGIAVFGPTAGAAQLEGSKAFAKEFMRRHGIPTADFHVFADPEAARTHLSSDAATYPLVLKADGLAAGKGVFLVDSADEALDLADDLLRGRLLPGAGSRIVVEQLLEGREVSYFALSDGQRWVELATCQDYKRAHDGDRGPNTGGMGTYSPSVYLDDATRRIIRDAVVEPTIRGLAADGHPYRGVLYVGLMLTAAGPKVLEYNARFGDPETQVLLPRLDGDWLTLLESCARGRLDMNALRWRSEAAVCVVMASEGYPATYRKGLPIEGVERAEAIEGVTVFHAGSRLDGGRLCTSGGRVFGVTALGTDLAAARERAYEAVDCIRWEGGWYRRDIAVDAVERQRMGGVER